MRDSSLLRQVQPKQQEEDRLRLETFVVAQTATVTAAFVADLSSGDLWLLEQKRPAYCGMRDSNLRLQAQPTRQGEKLLQLETMHLSDAAPLCEQHIYFCAPTVLVARHFMFFA